MSKKVSLSMTFKVPDDFEPGDCEKCPIAIKKGYESAMREYSESYSCPFVAKRELCPLDVIEQGCVAESG